MLSQKISLVCAAEVQGNLMRHASRWHDGLNDASLWIESVKVTWVNQGDGFSGKPNLK